LDYGNFGFKKQIQLPRKRTLGAARAFGDRLNAAERIRAPGNDQAGVTEFAFAQQDGSRGVHSTQTNTRNVILSEAKLQRSERSPRGQAFNLRSHK
jgi:hypothetical protein